MAAEYTSIEGYIATCDSSIQPVLQELRALIRQHAPNATEKIAWSMPTFYQKKNLIHFFAHKKHIGLYPGASGIEQFREEFDAMGLKYSKGAVQLPYQKPMPWELIGRIVDFRVEQEA